MKDHTTEVNNNNCLDKSDLYAKPIGKSVPLLRRKNMRNSRVLFLASLVTYLMFFVCSVSAQDTATDDSADDFLQPLAELGSYTRAETQFDGVLSQELVGFLKFTNNDTLLLPVLSTGIVDKPLNFTIAIWFKIEEYTGTDVDDYQTIFAFQDSVRCYITSKTRIMCDSASRAVLEVNSPEIALNQWINMVLSMRDDGFASLVLHTNEKFLGEDTMINFPFTQRVSRRWAGCFGSCLDNKGFKGGLREVMMLQKYIDHDVGDIVGHQVFVYDNSFKSYFRFGKDLERFNKDYFVDRTWLKFTGLKEGEPLSSVQGLDFISNDVCELSYDQEDYLKFGKGLSMEKHDLDKQLKQYSYDYTMSMQVFVNDTTCVTSSIATAEETDCSLVELEGVFMIYFLHSNMMQVRFLARKNFYETSTRVFFVPNDQWVTIQLVMSHYKGYRMVLLDQNGAEIYRFQEQRNMRYQVPNGNLAIGNALDGSIGEFYLCQSGNNIPMDPSKFDNCLINTKFTIDNVDGQTVKNQGNAGDMNIIGNASKMRNYALRQSKIGNPENLLAMGTIDGKISYDGLACNDENLLLAFEGQDTGFQFRTPTNFSSNVSQDAMTVEFWIKPTDDTFYIGDKKILFIMKDTVETLNQIREEKNLTDFAFNLNDATAEGDQLREFMKIYLRNNTLVCAPYGDLTENSVQAVLEKIQVGPNQTDQWGWWHVACSYKKGSPVTLTVSNSEFSVSVDSKTTADIGLPVVSLDAYFGKNGGRERVVKDYLLKEVRVWSNKRTQEELRINRFNQINSASLPEGQSLMNYYRLMAGSLTTANLAEYQPGYISFDAKEDLHRIALRRDYNNVTYFEKQPDFTYKAFVKPTYHVICPLNTYFFDFHCYGEPIEKPRIAILPQAPKEKDGHIHWQFNSEFSSLVKDSLRQEFRYRWTSPNTILNKLITEIDQTSKFYLDRGDLLLENTYPLRLTIDNVQQSFDQVIDVLWVPNVCQWFEIEGGEMAYKKTLIKDAPGKADQKFYIKEVRSTDPGCKNFDFYSKFDSFDTEFVLSGDNKFIVNYPNMNITEVQKDGEPLRFECVIPRAEQFKLPSNRYIYIIFTVHWTNANFIDVIDAKQLVFQNIVNEIHFEATEKVLVSQLLVNQNNIEGAMPLVLNASSSFVSNVQFYEARRNLTFEWTCPELFVTFCQAVSSPVIQIPWLDVNNIVNMTFDTPFEFSVNISWISDDKLMDNKILTKTIQWIRVDKPEFYVELQTAIILVSSKNPIFFRMRDLNITDDKLDDYNIVWTVTPALPDGATLTLQEGKQLRVAGGNWAKNTNYTTSVTMSHKLLPQLFTTVNSTSFRTFEPPYGGVVSTYPTEAYLGDEITLYCYSWESPNEPAYYLAYETKDSEGTIRGKAISKGHMLQNETLAFELGEYPTLVVIVDAIGEATTKIVKTTIKKRASVADAANATADSTADVAADAGRLLFAEDFDTMIDDVLLYEEINTGF